MKPFCPCTSTGRFFAMSLMISWEGAATDLVSAGASGAIRAALLGKGKHLHNEAVLVANVAWVHLDVEVTAHGGELDLHLLVRSLKWEGRQAREAQQGVVKRLGPS